MLTRADLLVLWSRSVDHDGPNHPLTQRVREAYEAAPKPPGEQPVTSTDISADSDERTVQWDPQN